MELSERDKKILVYGGAVALGVGFLFFILNRAHNTVIAGPATQSDNVQSAATTPDDSPGYTTYNLYPLTSQALGGESVAPAASSTTGATCGCGCGAGAGASLCSGSGNQLGDGTAYASLTQYLDYLKSTNPNYLQLYQAQVAEYGLTLLNGGFSVAPVGAA